MLFLYHSENKGINGTFQSNVFGCFCDRLRMCTFPSYISAFNYHTHHLLLSERFLTREGTVRYIACHRLLQCNNIQMHGIETENSVGLQLVGFLFIGLQRDCLFACIPVVAFWLENKLTWLTRFGRSK